MDDESRSMLLPKTVRPFWVIDTTSHTIKINGDGKRNVISTNRATLAQWVTNAPPVEQSKRNAQSDKAPTVKQSIQDAQCDTSTPKATSNKTHWATGHVPPTHNCAPKTDMYFVDHIDRLINAEDHTCYLVRCYRYTAADDTFRPSKHIPEPILNRYWSYAWNVHVTQSLNGNK